MSEGPRSLPPFLLRLVGPTARRIALVLLIAGFTLLAAVTMRVSGRQVQFAVRVYASLKAEPGASVALRITLYRPELHQTLSGTARVEHRDTADRLIESRSVELSSRQLTPAQFEVPGDALDDRRFAVSIRSQEGGQPREFAIEVPRGGLVDWVRDAMMPWASDASTWGGISDAALGLPQVRHLRIEPVDSEVRVELTTLTGIPVRWLENTFYLRLCRPEGDPLANHPLTVLTSADAAEPAHELVTDELGLAEFTATPEDIEIWQVHTVLDGQPVTAWFEVVPSWDGMILRVDPPVVSADQPFEMSLDSHLMGEQWHGDVFSNGSWMVTFSQPREQRRFRVFPPAGHWPLDAGSIRLLLAQAYSDPFSPDPQRSVRGVVVHPEDTSDLDAVRRLMAAVCAHGVDCEALEGLSRAGLPGSTTPRHSLHRLASFWLARAQLAFQAHPLVHDDLEEQTRLLAAETGRIRRTITWVLALGTAALVFWLGGRVAFTMWRTRQRTRALLTEMEDEGLEPVDGLKGAFGANAGPVGVLWAAIIIANLALFCAGIILLLTYL